jgi:hypothetical protein
MVDNGVLRKDEGARVHKMLTKDLGVNLTVVDASELFLSRLKGITDPERKRKIIGNTFIEVFEAEAAKIEAEAEKELEEKGGEAKGKIEWLLQGTLYPDVIESISFKGPSAVIKSHHNVGGLLADMKLKLIEPLRELFKGAFWLMIVPEGVADMYAQTRFVLSAVSSVSLPTSSAVTPSLAQVSLSVSSVRSPASRSRSAKRPTKSSSMRSVRLVFTIRSARLSLHFCPFRASASRVISAPTSR